jgi:hypothetical protein
MNEYKPQIGDMLQRTCGTLAIIEQVSSQGRVILGHVIQAPEWRRIKTGSIVRLPTSAIGKTWKVIA